MSNGHLAGHQELSESKSESKSEKKVLEVVTGPLMPKNSLNQNSVGFAFGPFRGPLKATLANSHYRKRATILPNEHNILPSFARILHI